MPHHLDSHQASCNTNQTGAHTGFATIRPVLQNSMRLLAILLLCCLSACAQRTDISSSKIADIEKNITALPTTSVHNTDQRNTLERYQHLLSRTQDADARRIMQRRIADLTLSSIEEKSATQALSANDLQNLNDALQRYEQLLNQQNNNEEKADILYQQARLHELLGQNQAMQTTLDALVKNHPDSPYFEEAQFRRAEQFYANKQFNDAVQAYRHVIEKNKDRRFYQQSLYKLAWSEYKINDYPSALRSFLGLIEQLENSVATRKNNSTVQQPLLKDSYRASSLSLAHLNGAHSVEKYFNAHGSQNFEYKVYEALGQYYLEHERYNDAASTLEHFVITHPLDTHGPDFQTQTIKALRAGNFSTLALAATERYNDYFGIHSAFWPQNKDNTTFRNALKTQLSTLSTYYHSVAVSSANHADYQKAAHWYRILLETFPDDADSLISQQLLAQSLLEAHRFTEAIEQFSLLASDPRTAANDAANSRYAIVMICEQALATLPENSNQARQMLLQQTQAAEQFYTKHPNDKRTQALLNNTLITLIKLKENQKSFILAQHIIQLPPSSENAAAQLNAWITLGNAHMEADRFAEAEFAFDHAQTLTTDHEFRSFLQENRALALYKYAQQQQKIANNDTQKAQAAQHYARIGQLLPQSKIRPEADFAATVIYLENQQWSEAIQALSAFRKRFPNHALNETVPDKLALAYEKNAQWQDAASELQGIHQGFAASDPELARQALWKAAQLLEQSPDKTAALNAYTRYAQSYPHAFETVVEAQYKLSLMAQENQTQDQHIYWLLQIKQSYLRAGQRATARMHYQAAYSAYSLGRIYQQQVKNIPLRQPLDQSIQAKKPLLETSVKHFNEAIQLGEAQFVTAAMFQQAELYRQLAKDLLASEPPAKLDAEALEQYQLLLEEQALPIEDKAIALYQQNTALTKQGIYDRWVKKSYLRLKTLLPARYAKDEKLESDFDVAL